MLGRVLSGHASSGLLSLRPVTFRYQKSYADGSKPVDYGLIAEEWPRYIPTWLSKAKTARSRPCSITNCGDG